MHRGTHRLGGEELVLEVHRHPLVPVFGRHFVDRVAIVVGGVVDQHVAPAEPVDQLGDLGAVIDAVGDVAVDEERRHGRVGEARDERLARLVLHVDEGDRRPLAGESLDDPLADPAAATADDDALAGQAGIDRPVRHRLQNPFGQAVHSF